MTEEIGIDHHAEETLMMMIAEIDDLREEKYLMMIEETDPQEEIETDEMMIEGKDNTNDDNNSSIIERFLQFSVIYSLSTVVESLAGDNLSIIMSTYTNTN